MPTNYEIRKSRHTYEVVEKPTKQVICFTRTAKRAKLLVNFLNQGGGFDGNTPRFLTNANKVKL